MYEKVVEATEHEFNVPAKRVGFEHRIQVLLNQIDELEDALDEANSRLEEVERQRAFAGNTQS
jgi:hypothetical protein